MQHFLSRDATFSLAITPSLDRQMYSGSADAGFVLALPFHHRDLEPDGVGLSARGGGGWEPSAEREEAGRSIAAAGGPRSRRQFNNRQSSGLNKLAIDREIFSGSVDVGFVLELPFHLV